MSNEQKTGYKYRIGFHQSLTTGVVGFEGNIQFDEGEENAATASDKLMILVSSAEQSFKGMGYRVASDIEPKAQQVKNGQSKEKVKR